MRPVPKVPWQPVAAFVAGAAFAFQQSALVVNGTVYDWAVVPSVQGGLYALALYVLGC